MTTPTTSNYRYVGTTEAYDHWSHIYDADNNFLQAVDSFKLQSILPDILSRLPETTAPNLPKFVDLGCGTGRGIMLLDKIALELDIKPTIVGLDASPGMLKVAQRTIQQAHLNGFENKIILQHFEMPQAASESSDSELRSKIPACAAGADFILSTLVLEHIPLSVFFATAARILKPKGTLLITNMHPDMGKSTQAGFLDEATGEVIRPKSYIYSIDEVVRAARDAGFELETEPMEAAVDELNWGQLGPRAEKWIGTKVWFALCFECRA